MNRILCHIARLPQHKVVQLKSGSKSTLHVIRPFPVVDGSRDLPLFLLQLQALATMWLLSGNGYSEKGAAAIYILCFRTRLPLPIFFSKVESSCVVWMKLHYVCEGDSNRKWTVVYIICTAFYHHAKCTSPSLSNSITLGYARSFLWPRACVDGVGLMVTGQLADKPTRGRSSGGLINSLTSQLAEMVSV